MKITYSIQVCNESRELYSLVNFLLKVIDEDDNVQFSFSLEDFKKAAEGQPVTPEEDKMAVSDLMGTDDEEDMDTLQESDETDNHELKRIMEILKDMEEE